MRKNTYKFDGSCFEWISPPFTYPDTVPDWDQYLLSKGWKKMTAWPAHQVQEFSEIQAYLYNFKGQDSEPEFEHLIEILIADSFGVDIFCANAIDLLYLMRDWLLPLIRGSDQMAAMQTLIDAGNKLLDTDTGLECAQRYGVAERRRREYLREVRAQRKTVPKE